MHLFSTMREMFAAVSVVVFGRDVSTKMFD